MDFKRFRLVLKGKNLPLAHLTLDDAVERAKSLAWLYDQEYTITNDGIPVVHVSVLGTVKPLPAEEF